MEAPPPTFEEDDVELCNENHDQEAIGDEEITQVEVNAAQLENEECTPTVDYMGKGFDSVHSWVEAFNTA